MANSKRPLFCIVDASSFIFRAYYAVRPLSNKQGLPTNAVFGFAQMIIKVLEDFHPAYLAIVYDTKAPSFRKEMYTEYKANRGAMPEDLAPQIPYIKKFVETLGLPAFERPGYEADDVIATLSQKAAIESHEADVCIISSDKDLMQLVGDGIYLYDTMKEQKYTAKEVEEKLGVSPELVADYLGIVGDTSDNIPGVKGIGPKGAAGLLKEYGSLEAVYENLHKLKGKQKEQLENSRENAFLSKKLATVKRDLVIPEDWHKLKCTPSAGPEFFALLEELEFHGLLKRAQAGDFLRGRKPGAVQPAEAAAPSPGHEGDAVAALQPRYTAIRSLAELKKALEALNSAPSVAIDTETTSLSVRSAEIVGFSFCAEDKEAFYVPLRHEDESGNILSGQCDPVAALEAFGEFLAGKRIIGQNLKYDICVLRSAGVSIPREGIDFDTMIASYILSPEERHNLDALADKYLGHKNTTYESICGSGKDEIPFARVPVDKAAAYAAEDAHVAFLLSRKLRELLAGIPALENVFRTIDLPLVSVLSSMEWEGVAVNVPHLKELSAEFGRELERLEAKAYALAGAEFNLASPKQLQKILFEDLNLPPVKKTKTGYSTDVEVLEKLSLRHPLPRVILEHRELSKLKSTYVDVLPALVDGNTGRVHARFNQTVAATGRLSSSDPNLQNIPIRTDSGKRVREAFVAGKGRLLLGADYSQIELRILASMSGDEALCRAFQEKRDIHALAASQIFSIPLEEVKEHERRQAKAINFGILYGKSAFSLSEELGISRTDAAEIIKTYFERYPTIRTFLDGLVSRTKETGYAETVFGRRRNIDGIHSKNKTILAMAERMAVNTPIQGTAADLIKIAMNDLHAELSRSSLRAAIILQVHDELVLEVHRDDVEEAKILMKKTMEGAGHGKIHVPLTVDMGAAENWLKL